MLWYLHPPAPSKGRAAVAIRLLSLVHVERPITWAPVAGCHLYWRLGCWCPHEYGDQALDFIDSFLTQAKNLDPSPVTTANRLYIVLKQFVPDLKGVTIHDGGREWMLQVEDDGQ